MKLKYIIIITTILIMFFIFGMTIEPFTPKIDIVYTWVCKYDPERELYKDMLPDQDQNTDVNRYNNNNELKYSIRSLFKYCSWINTIYIVVKDGQCPEFIDFTNPKVVLVNHSEIMPIDALPTFNSNAIECCIHNIKNLSDVYVYMNDDFFVSEPFVPVINKKIQVNLLRNPDIHFTTVEPGDDGPYTFDNMHKNTVFYGQKFLNGNINIGFLHTPSVCYKPWEIEMLTLLDANNLLTPTVMSKFRHNTNIIINNCFRTLFYLTKGQDIHVVRRDNIYNDLSANGKCTINSEAQFVVNSINDTCSTSFTEQMGKLYPQPSPVENRRI